MAKSERLDSIMRAASKKAAEKKGTPVTRTVESPFSPAMNPYTAAKQGARTGFNPNPGVAPVKVTTYEPEAPSRPRLKAPASRWSPPMDKTLEASRANSPVSVSTQRPGRAVAPPAPVSAPASTDALLDRAKAQRAARAQPKPPSGAITGPKLRQGVAPRSKVSPPMNVATSVQQPVSVSVQRPGRPPAPAAPAPPKLKAGYAPASKVAPPMAPRARPKVGGGGWRGALISGGASATINAGQAAEAERQRRKKAK